MTAETRIAREDAGQRFDRWYRRRIGPISQSRLERFCRLGRVRIDGKRIKCATRIAAGQSVHLPPECRTRDNRPAPALPPAARHALDGLLDAPLFEDDHLLAINKPAGLATQGGPGQHVHLDLVLAQTGRAGRDPLRLVHRLDKDTSGVLLLGKTLPAVQAMGALLRGRDVRKDYVAVTIRPPQPRTGSIAIPLRIHDRSHRVTWRHETDPAPRPGEKAALTHYRVLATAGSGPALVVLCPVTGRKHQLRAHLAAIDCPIIGDGRYGIPARHHKDMPWSTTGDPTLHLHALSLGFAHPITHESLVIEAPPPAHMQTTCQILGWSHVPYASAAPHPDAIA